MCAIVQEWVHDICAHCDPNISRINDKFSISQINVSPLCGISKMSYHSSILLMLLAGVFCTDKIQGGQDRAFQF
jgi:hypothetical protein